MQEAFETILQVMSREHCSDLDMISGCCHESGKHLYNAGRQCQWCHKDMKDIELVKRRDAMRWRKFPEEKPDKKGRYLVCTDGSSDIKTHVSYFSINIGWATKDSGIAYWRPIENLPKG